MPAACWRPNRKWRSAELSVLPEFWEGVVCRATQFSFVRDTILVCVCNFECVSHGVCVEIDSICAGPKKSVTVPAREVWARV